MRRRRARDELFDGPRRRAAHDVHRRDAARARSVGRGLEALRGFLAPASFSNAGESRRTPAAATWIFRGETGRGGRPRPRRGYSSVGRRVAATRGDGRSFEGSPRLSRSPRPPRRRPRPSNAGGAASRGDVAATPGTGVPCHGDAASGRLPFHVAATPRPDGDRFLSRRRRGRTATASRAGRRRLHQRGRRAAAFVPGRRGRHGRRRVHGATRLAPGLAHAVEDGETRAPSGRYPRWGRGDASATTWTVRGPR